MVADRSAPAALGRFRSGGTTSGLHSDISGCSRVTATREQPPAAAAARGARPRPGTLRSGERRAVVSLAHPDRPRPRSPIRSALSRPFVASSRSLRTATCLTWGSQGRSGRLSAKVSRRRLRDPRLRSAGGDWCLLTGGRQGQPRDGQIDHRM